MKNFKTLLLIIVATFSLGVQAQQYDFSALSGTNTLFYKILNDTSVALVAEMDNIDNSYTIKPSGDLIIPENITQNDKTYSVTKIGAKAFDSCNELTGSLIIPNSVKIVEDYAFRGCGFTEDLIIGNSVTEIGASAFGECKFTGDFSK